MTLLAVGLIGVGCLLVAVLAQLGATAVSRTRASASADVTALAGVTGGATAAETVAAANGSRIVDWQQHDRALELTVQRHGIAASARAVPASPGSPALRAVLARAEQLLEQPVQVDSWLPDGISVLVAADTVEQLAALSEQSGLCQQRSLAYPVHFKVCQWTRHG